MKEKHTKLIEVSEEEFLENLIKQMEEYYSAYEEIKSVYEQYLFDKEYYRIKYFYDDKNKMYLYTKYKKSKIGFRGS